MDAEGVGLVEGVEGFFVDGLADREEGDAVAAAGLLGCSR